MGVCGTYQCHPRDFSLFFSLALFATFLTMNGATVTDPITKARITAPKGVGEGPRNGMKPNSAPEFLGFDVDDWDKFVVFAVDVVACTISADA